jgi:hypothetical protein
MMAALRQRGWKITHDWTACDDSGLEGRALSGYREVCARADALGVALADVFVLLYHPESRNALVELGVAVGSGTKVVAVGAQEDHGLVFLELSEVDEWREDEQFLEAVDRGWRP